MKRDRKIDRFGWSSKIHLYRGLLLAFFLVGSTVSAAVSTNYLDELDLSLIRQGWGTAQKNRSVTKNPLQIAGRRFLRGIGTHARSVFWIQCPKDGLRFQAWVGVDDGARNPGASVQFVVYGDGKRLWDSGLMRWKMPAKRVDISIAGVHQLLLYVKDGGDGIHWDHADWAEARILSSGGGKPKAIPVPVEKKELRTPPFPKWPEIHGPKVYGCRPGHPFLDRIPTTGKRPIHFRAIDLPEGIQLEPTKGILRGKAPAAGTYTVHLIAENEYGRDERTLKIVSGRTLALTPPMGWNHWYAHYNRVTDRTIREAARLMVESGMADVGYQYVSIDDCWARAPRYPDPKRTGPLRDAQGNILPNAYFPDMKALTDYIHSFGLKAGIYSSPGPRTCAGFAGSYRHEAQDARQFAAWGFDLLKYDWCSYGRTLKRKPTLEDYQRPYRLMGSILQSLDRDIVLNICQYGMGEVWKWGKKVGGHSWRTGGDLGFELHRFFEVALRNAKLAPWNGPGGWNDPDYIQIGYIGNARGMGKPQPCPLSPNEQYSFFSLWCLLAAPLFYSGDMAHLDRFTRNILCNPELIEVDQDPLGITGRVIWLEEEVFAMVKPLEDGSRAIGIFNMGEFPIEVTVRWNQIGIAGTQLVRDLWRRRNLGPRKEGLSVQLPRRGCEVYRLWPITQPSLDKSTRKSPVKVTK